MRPDVVDSVRSGPPLLSLRELRRGFDGREVIRALSLTLEAGERVCLRGPNGSGKSTVLRCIAGTLTVDRGEVAICGHRGGSLNARRLVGVSLAQERSFYLRLTGLENLRFFARIRLGSRETARRVDALVEELEIATIAAERVDRCSTGMVQQLGFARALLGEPKLLLLDEPTRSLDSDAVSRLWAALDRRPQVGVVVATHRDDDLRHCGGRVELPS